MTIAIRPVPGPPRDYHFPRFEQRILENGMRVIVAPLNKLPVVSIVAVVDASAVRDPHGKEGLAELTAQALREGTIRRDGLQLAIDFERLGTSIETGADWDGTVVSVTVLRSRLDPAFALFSEALRSPGFRESDVERLRAERLAERLQLLSEPRGLADESFDKFLYMPGSRYSEPMSGSTKSVSGLSREDVAGFYGQNYVPTGTTIILAGDITLEEGISLVERAFSSWQGSRNATVVQPDVRARTSHATEIVAKADAEQSELRLGHVGVPRTHPDYFRIVVMNSVLGGLFSSRINLNLREVHGYTYGASSDYDWRRGAGPFVISAAVQSEVTGNAITETLKEIERLRSEEIGEEELTLATSYLAGVFPIRYETTSAIAAALASMVTFDLPETYYDTYRQNIRAVSTRDVLETAQKYVNPGQLQLVVVGDPQVVKDQVEALDLGPLTIRDATER